jgi:NAD+ synthase
LAEILDPDVEIKYLYSLMKIDCPKIAFSLENFIREYMEKLERDGIILGLSGGIDSAVAAALCKEAVGSDKVLALIMPEKDSREEHVKDAQLLAKNLDLKTKLLDISPILKKMDVYHLFTLNKFPLPDKHKEKLVKKAYDYYEKQTSESPFSASILGFRGKDFLSQLQKNNAYYRVKHRIRMVLLYLYAELENRLVVGCANKTESQIGFFVKHGCDDASDIMPLLNLYKTQVRELARYLEIPSEILNKPPSPDIIPGIIDEEAIGISYDKLDLILLGAQTGWKTSELAKALGVEDKEVLSVKKMIEKSEHMRKIYVP